jgi:hypothetical protein
MYETISGKENDIYSKEFNCEHSDQLSTLYKVDIVILYFINYFCRLVQRINWFDLHLDMYNDGRIRTNTFV